MRTFIFDPKDSRSPRSYPALGGLIAEPGQSYQLDGEAAKLAAADRDWREQRPKPAADPPAQPDPAPPPDLAPTAPKAAGKGKSKT